MRVCLGCQRGSSRVGFLLYAKKRIMIIEPRVRGDGGRHVDLKQWSRLQACKLAEALFVTST